MAEIREKRDLILPPGTYAFMQDGTKGIIKVNTGPTVITPSAQDVPVVYDAKSGTFRRCDSLEEALRKSPVVVEGYYCNLLNPAKSRRQPDEGGSQQGTELDVGRKIVIPGPAMFSLWPGQVAEVIRGHHLRSNQYLLVRVYNEDEARKNWGKAVVKPATKVTEAPGPHATEEEKAAYELALKTEAETVKVATAPPPKDLTVGKLLVIQGTEVSFYIPPTGISVVPDGTDDKGKHAYVREALTLERLEYAILIDENGKKRYANGPTVVFPAPTEKFMEARGDDGHMTRKFRAIELNDIQGLHLKVIADYKDEKTGKEYKAGEELFVTGKDTQIYYPREEHSAIKYDGKTKHFATAIPAGEGRYVLNRLTGEIRMVKGPDMLLPDPRTEVIVRRVLSDKQTQLWYPGNNEALVFNQELRRVLSQVPTTRGAPSEGDVLRNYKGKEEKTKGGLLAYAATAAVIADSSSVSREQNLVGGEFSRASSYTAPRMVTLDTKYQGVPTVEVWTGYAVLVVSKSGGRRVEVGPKTILLEYDESFEVLELSTGKPKTTDNLLRTVYLRTDNNQVTDIVQVETSDHIPVSLRLGYRVNFEGDNSKWWAVENYVKFLCDEIRSLLKGQVKKFKIEEFDANATEIVRTMILGAKGEGRLFQANNMRITDVEVLSVDIQNQQVKQALAQSQLAVVQTNIELSQLRRGKEVTEQREAIVQEEVRIRSETAKLKNTIDAELAASALELALKRLANKLSEISEQRKLDAEAEERTDFIFNADLARNRRTSEQRLALEHAAQVQEIERLKAEAEAVVTKFTAIGGNFSEALLALSRNETLVKVAEAWNIQRAIGGDSVSDALSKVFSSTPLAPLMAKLTSPTSGIVPSNGASEKSGLTAKS